MTITQGWAVVDESDGVHVVPWDMLVDAPARAHTVDQQCWCQPTGSRDDPGARIVWDHHEAGWPGSEDRLQ